MFERHDQPLVSRRRFAVRVIAALAIGLGIDLSAVMIGAAGYRLLERLSWIDALTMAVLVSTGNGPLVTPHTFGSKVFLIFDALVGVLVFVTVAGVILAPIFHRLLHAFHIEVNR